MTGTRLLRSSSRSCSAVTERVLFSSHQLGGPIDEWWDAYVNVHEEPGSINW
jgi:hypothetical protein